MRPYKIKVGAGQTVELGITGDYVRVSESLVLVTLETIDNQNKVTLSEGEELSIAQFTGLRISHDDAIEQEITLYVARGARIGSSQVAGAVSLKNEQGAFVQSRASVTNAAAQLLAVNADRRYLMIQNNDSAATLRITLDGSEPAVGAGFRLGPGESMELAGFMTNGAINGFMETATATAGNVEICEG